MMHILNLKVIVLLSNMLTVVCLSAASSRTGVRVALILLFVLKIKLDAFFRRPHAERHFVPSKIIDAFLLPTWPPPDDICVICRDEFTKTVRISCRHKFCRSCAILTLSTRECCPVCNVVPTPLHNIHSKIHDFEDQETWDNSIILWILLTILWAITWGATSLLFYGTQQAVFDLCFALVRAAIHVGLMSVMWDVLQSLETMGPEVGDREADAIMWLFFCVWGITNDYTVGAVRWLLG